MIPGPATVTIFFQGAAHLAVAAYFIIVMLRAKYWGAKIAFFAASAVMALFAYQDFISFSAL
jgi:hypothetical protein